MSENRRRGFPECPPPPTPKPPAEAVIEDEMPGCSWFAGLRVWWNKPRDRSRPGYNDPRFAQPCHKPSVAPPPLPGSLAWRFGYVPSAEQAKTKKRNEIVQFTKLAADLSATTHISPGEALEMIRKAGNFASREELDRLVLENADLRQAFEACSCDRSNAYPYWVALQIDCNKEIPLFDTIADNAQDCWDNFQDHDPPFVRLTITIVQCRLDINPNSDLAKIKIRDRIDISKPPAPPEPKPPAEAVIEDRKPKERKE